MTITLYFDSASSYFNVNVIFVESIENEEMKKGMKNKFNKQTKFIRR